MRSLTLAIFLSTSIFVSACASAAPPAASASSPQLQCEFRLGAWCIAQGAYVVTRTMAGDHTHDRVWSLSGRFKPESGLLIKEVNGCKFGYADELSILSYESSIEIEGTQKDRVKVRLKSDGTCDLDLFIPPFDGDPMEWAFSTGFALIRGCKDEECTPLPFADLKPQIESRFKGLE